ncbi:MAG TPA: tripartite tricarboxylate transporter substrate binding protein [Xanthobacteraceae bacterium]|jgi:tripartite-type tricarboxylate transporter receptor subunit TctC|nr:tripartite tricarboxylate transporter substrate binding protein [Xanthobacteraceae bacterium]
MGRRKTLAAFITIAVITALGGALHGRAAQAQAQVWPQRPVRVIVPYAAGGNSDGMARMVAQRLGDAFGQTFIVENRLGANGAIATEAVARSAADGYTLLWAVTPPVAISPALTKVNYHPIKDFAPISAVAVNAFVLVVNKSFPPKTVAEFIAYVREQPNKLAYSESGVGSLTHLTMALFLKRAGLQMTNVSYRGNAPALTDVVAGHLPTMFSSIADAIPQAAAGAIRLLAVSGKERAPQLPDVPTVAESGFPGFNVLTWNGLMAPAGTPEGVVDKIAAEIGHSVKDPQFAARLDEYGVDPLGNTPAEFRAMVVADTDLWAETVQSLGLKF